MHDLQARHPDYKKYISVWNYLDSCYKGIDSWVKVTDKGFEPRESAQLFMPRNSSESPENWLSRLNQTQYDNFYKKGIKRTVDLAFQTAPIIEGSEKSPFLDNYDRITKDGHGFEYLLRQLAISTLIYGKAYVLIDSQLPQNTTYKEFKSNQPYIVPIDTLSVVNWYKIDNRFEYVLTQEVVNVFENYKYISCLEFRCYEPGYCYVYRLKEVDYDDFQKGKCEANLIQTISTGLDYVPFYEIKDSFGDELSLAFRDVADKNRVLYQKQSYHQRKITLCCLPVPVIKSSSRDPNEPLVLGPDNFIQIEEEGSFTWQEPLALSLKESRDDVNDLIASLNDDIAQFLMSPVSRQSATATEIMVQPVEANLTSFLVVFLQYVNLIVNGYNVYMGSDAVNYVLVNPDIYSTEVIDSQFLFALVSFYESGILTKDQVYDIINNKYSLLKFNLR